MGRDIKSAYLPLENALPDLSREGEGYKVYISANFFAYLAAILSEE
jgi:hypothetical protein